MYALQSGKFKVIDLAKGHSHGNVYHLIFEFHFLRPSISLDTLLRDPNPKRRVRDEAQEGRVGEGARRWSAKSKRDAVLRLLRGEDLDTVSRESKVTAAKLTEWREAFLASGMAGLKARETDARDEEIERLKAVLGEMTMRCELQRDAIRRLKAGLPLDETRLPK